MEVLIQCCLTVTLDSWGFSNVFGGRLCSVLANAGTYERSLLVIFTSGLKRVAF